MSALFPEKIEKKDKMPILDQSQKESSGPKQAVDDMRQTLSHFNWLCEEAKRQGEEWLEVDPVFIQYFNRQGLGMSTRDPKKPNRYFIYKDIKVCGFGEKEDILKEERRTIQELMGAPLEGVDELKVEKPQAPKPVAKA